MSSAPRTARGSVDMDLPCAATFSGYHASRLAAELRRPFFWGGHCSPQKGRRALRRRRAGRSLCEVRGRRRSAPPGGRVARLGVTVVVDREAEGTLLDAERPDAVILATGGVSIVPGVPGTELSHVVRARDVAAGKVSADRRVVVIGGGAVGAETALFLAENGTPSGEASKFLLVHGVASPEEPHELAVRGARGVVIVELLEGPGRGFGKTTRWAMLQDVERRGVRTTWPPTIQAWQSLRDGPGRCRRRPPRRRWRDAASPLPAHGRSA
jgi:hypothetical protein